MPLASSPASRYHQPVMKDYLYKILRGAEWRFFDQTGSFSGSADDLRDGFIHLSAQDQLAGTLAHHFDDADSLILLALDFSDDRQPRLKWGKSRSGALFPHYFAPLERRHIKHITPLNRGGKHQWQASSNDPLAGLFLSGSPNSD